jgi:predicted transcriptional regulator
MSPDVVPETPRRRLTRIQSGAVVMLAEGKRTDQVAKDTGMSQRTIQRWLAEDDLFAETLEGLQEEIVKASLRHLKAIAVRAAEAVGEMMESGTSDDTVRIRAAQDILDRVHGKATIRIAGGGEGEPPIHFELVHPGALKQK